MVEPGQIEVLIGHRVSDKPGCGLGPDARNSVRPAALAAWLDAQGDRLPLRCSDLYTKSLPGRGFLLSFDDGYRDNLTEALPLLEKRDVPVLIFITTGFVEGEVEPVEDVIARLVGARSALRTPGGRELACGDAITKKQVYEQVRLKLKSCGVAGRYQLLSEFERLNAPIIPAPRQRFLCWDEVRELDRHPLVTIGAHTRTHPLLTRASRREAEREIRESREILERHLGHPIEAFAYPYGGHNWRIRRLVARCGFRLAFTTEPHALQRAVARRRYRIPRLDLVKVLDQEPA